MTSQYRILISAYACEPRKGSEQGVGWHWVQQVSRYHEAWVITRANNRHVIERELKNYPNDRLHFSYVDLPRWACFWKRGERGLYLYYCLWQVAAYRLAKRLHKEFSFDLSHHLTFGNVWLPTFLWHLPIPFVWGPVGGYEKIPSSFLGIFSLKYKLLEYLRSVWQSWGWYLNPFLRRAARGSSFIIGRTEMTSKFLSAKYPEIVITMMETGISQAELSKSVADSTDLKRANGANILMVGRLIACKGFNLGIKAFKILRQNYPNSMLHIVGSGPEADALKRLCQLNGLAENVVFHGQLRYNEVLEMYKKADIFLHPGLREGGVWVIFEAMAAGLPVVCFDNSGAGEIVTESSGIKVKANSPAQAVEDLAAALKCLIQNKVMRLSLGQGARKRINDFDWDRKGEFINDIYKKAISSRKK